MPATVIVLFCLAAALIALFVGFRVHLTRSREGKMLGKNVMQFSLYRKFGADATITFDTPDPIPEDQLKEQPLRPAR